MFPAALRSVMRGGNLTKATALAREMAEMIQTEPFDALLTTPNAGNTGRDTTTSTPEISRDLSTLRSSIRKHELRYGVPEEEKWTCDIVPDGTLANGRGCR